MSKTDLFPKKPFLDVNENQKTIDKPTAAQDLFLLEDITSTITKKTKTNILNNDPITEYIRDNIISLQMETIQQSLLDNNQNEEEKDKIKTNFRQYLQDNPAKYHEAFESDKTLKDKFQNIEITGYKNLHKKFDNYKNLDWQAPENNGVRTKEVKNKEGKLACNLTEVTNVNNGITSRSVDFPKSLNEGTGPLHVSLAVKDIKGNNIDESKAVYFTAHYDKEGKLTEVSSPQPIKFEGKGKDAIGFIEIEGEKYTLPVTKEKYEEMMIEVGVNKGLGLNMSQLKSAPAVDKILNIEKPLNIDEIKSKDSTKTIVELEKIADKQKTSEKNEEKKAGVKISEIKAPYVKSNSDQIGDKPEESKSNTYKVEVTEQIIPKNEGKKWKKGVINKAPKTKVNDKPQDSLVQEGPPPLSKIQKVNLENAIKNFEKSKSIQSNATRTVDEQYKAVRITLETPREIPLPPKDNINNTPAKTAQVAQNNSKNKENYRHSM